MMPIGEPSVASALASAWSAGFAAVDPEMNTGFVVKLLHVAAAAFAETPKTPPASKAATVFAARILFLMTSCTLLRAGC
jgi:hypothetical protein